MPDCRVCGAMGKHPRFSAREMMFGLREIFEYFQCTHCGCLQITEPPSDLSPYYANDYYSFADVPNSNALKRYFKRQWASHILGNTTPLGALLHRKYGVPPMLDWVRRAGIRSHQRILDVGCGSGQLLQSLSGCGFSNLTGVDPFVDRDIRYRSGVRVLKRKLEDLTDTYDLIILSHSYEHMGDPLAALRQVHRLLRKGGVALLRFPLSDGYAWRTYGIDWVQLDAPRHLFLHTEKSLRVLAERVDLKIEEIVYDSTAFQFWGSEQYRRDIPLRNEFSYAVNPSGAMFSRQEIERFDLLAGELNEEGDGDQASFYLRK